MYIGQILNSMFVDPLKGQTLKVFRENIVLISVMPLVDMLV